jgi:hypothetical protein
VSGDPLKRALPDHILDEEGEGRELNGGRSVGARRLEIDRLARPPAR